MDINLLNSIVSKIDEYDKIALYRHVFPDPDSYGSQMAVRSIIENTFKDKKVYVFGQHSEALGYIGKMDDRELEEEIDKDTLAIILDVSDKERVDNQSFNKCGYVIKIDHHKPFDEPFEDLTWVDTNYSSCSEMILDLYINSSKKLQISEEGRKGLFAGIIGDTGRFLYIEEPADIFKKLSEIAYGFNTKEIYSQMYKRKREELQFLGYIYNNFEVTENGVAYLKIGKEILDKFKLESVKAARMVNALQDTEGVINWHFFAEKPETGEVVCEFRSNGPAVNDIAAKYGGGGHFLAGGATVENWDVVDKIINDFDISCKQYMEQNK